MFLVQQSASSVSPTSAGPAAAPAADWRGSFGPRFRSWSNTCDVTTWGGGVFPWLPGCLLCGWVWEGVPMTVSYPVCVCIVCVVRSLVVLSAGRCDEVVYIAVQKAQGQHNTIPPGSVCLSVWLWGGLPDNRFFVPDWISWSGKCCSLKYTCTVNMHFVTFGLCLCLHVSVCIAVDVQIGGCGLFLPLVSRLTAHLFDSAGVDCAACMHVLCACVCHMMKKCFAVSLTVFTGQFVFRVRLGWVFLVSYSH